MSRGADGTQPREPKWMQAIVIGGPASGMIIKQIRVNATTIELSRPEYLKPLAYSKQAEAQPEMIRDRYDVCTLFLARKDGTTVPFGLVIKEGKSVRWAMSELVRGFAQNVLNEIAAENLTQ